MANKPTSVASIVAKQAAEKRNENEKEDKKLSKKAVPEGFVWVRLRRPHYDSAGVYHTIGPALLQEDKIPSTAKRLTTEETAIKDEETAAEDEDDE